MSGLADLPDPEKGQKMFENLYGQERGRRRFRAILRFLVPLAIVAAFFFLIAQIAGSWSTIYSGARGLFSQLPSSQQPPGTQKCVITGGTNNGTQIQNCPN